MRETPAGYAFEVTTPSEEVAERLRKMPEKMRAKAEAASARAEHARKPDETDRAPGGPTAEANRSTDESPSGSDQEDGPMPVEGTPVDTWRLDQTPMSQVLRALLEVQERAVLDVTFDDRRAQIAVDGSRVLDVEIYPRSPREGVAHLLLNAGKLDDEEVERAQRYAARHGVTVGEALVELEMLQHAEVRVALRTRVRFLLGVLWPKRNGRASLYRVERFDRRFLTPASPLLYHLFRRLRDTFMRRDDEWFEERHSFFRAHRIARNEEKAAAIDELELTGEEAHLYELVLDEERPASDVFRMSHLGRQGALALLEAFRQLELITLEKVNAFSRQRTRIFEQVERLSARIESGDHFEVFGLHWTATQEDVERAYRERREELCVDDRPADLGPEIDRKIDELAEALEATYEILGDRKRRASYRDEVVGTYKQKNAIAMYEDQADAAKMRRDLPAAIDACEHILELEPGHAQAKKDIEVLKKLHEAERRRASKDSGDGS
ncbi:MAG: hypothetical protein ACOCV2_03275 [Persicimonas sp.]